MLSLFAGAELKASVIDGGLKKLGAVLLKALEGVGVRLPPDEFWKGSCTVLLFPLAELFSPFTTLPFPTIALLLPYILLLSPAILLLFPNIILLDPVIKESFASTLCESMLTI